MRSAVINPLAVSIVLRGSGLHGKLCFWMDPVRTSEPAISRTRIIA